MNSSLLHSWLLLFGAIEWVSAQYVCLAVSSIPVWSALVGPYILGVPLVIFHTVIVAGVRFSGTSSCSQGPLNRFCFSIVRIRSLLEVISMSSVVGQVALNWDVVFVSYFRRDVHWPHWCYIFWLPVLLLVCSSWIFLSGFSALACICSRASRRVGNGQVCVPQVCSFMVHLVAFCTCPWFYVVYILSGCFFFCIGHMFFPVLIFCRGG